jgi:outer membrane protein assembly factor BamA
MNRQALSSAQRATRLALAVSALFASTLVHAETGPWYVGARETITHDSNVYRTPDPTTSDTIFSTGLFGGFDQQISRQRLRANVEANWNRYRNVDALNHTDADAGLRLDWETVAHLSGDAQLNYGRRLYRDFTAASQAQKKVLYDTTGAAFNARLGVVTAWTLEAGVFGNRTRFDAPLTGSNLDYDGYRAGARFSPSALSSIGLAYRRTSGKYPNTAGQGDFDRDDVDLLLNWRPTGSSSFIGRLSRTKLDFPNIGTRSDTLTTGELTYQWRPGGRTTVDLTAQRDSSAGRAAADTSLVDVITGRNFQQQSATARVDTSVGLNAGYELTGKIRLGLDLRHSQRDLDNSIEVINPGGQPVPGLGGPPLHGTDRTNTASLNITYDATRTLRFACGFTRLKRTIGGEESAQLTYPFAVNLTSCSAQLALQP